MAKKFLSALLAVLLVVSMVPMTAMAEGSVIETTPTIVAGVSADGTKAATAIGKILTRTVTCEGDHMDKGVLWFAMTGLGTNIKYSLSVTDSKGNELLGDKYVSYEDTSKLITGNANGNNYIYVALAPEHAGENGTGKQIDSKVLNPGTFTVTLSKGGSPLASTTITLSKNNTTGVWSGSGTPAVNAKEILFKKADLTEEFSKPVSDLQSGTPSFDVTAAGEENSWNVKVSGLTLKYASGYTAGFAGYEQHGYYAAYSIPKVLGGRIINKAIVGHTKMDENGNGTASTKDLLNGAPVSKVNEVFTEYNGSYCDTVSYLGETAEEAKKATKVMKLTYGDLPEQTYTFDFSGLTFPDETVKAEAATAASNKLLDKNINELQSDITATADPATKTIKVTGTSYQITTEWTEFSPSNNTGNFVALKLTNKAGVPMQLYSPTEKTNADKGWKDITSDGIIITRLQNLKDDKYIGKIKVGKNKGEKEGTEWTIDYTGVDRRTKSRDLEVDALTGVINITGNTKKGSDLQSNITTYRKKVGDTTTIYVNGTSNYVTDFTKFSSTHPEWREGNFVALKLTADGTIKVDGTECTDGEVVARLGDPYVTEANGYKSKPITVEKTDNGTTTTDKYIIDYSGVKCLPAEIQSATVNPSAAPDKKLEGLTAAYDKINDQIVLSGRVSPKANNSNLFNDATVTVTYGKEGSTKPADVVIRFVKNGDALDASADPATVAGNELTFDTSMLFIKNPDSAEIAITDPPKAAVSEDIPEEQQEAAKEISTALAATNGATIENAVLQKYADSIANDTTAKEDLISEAAQLVADDEKVPAQLKANIEAAADGAPEGVTTVVQTYAKIEVVGITDGETEGEVASFELSITPMARTIVSFTNRTNNMKVFDPEADSNTGANAIAVKDEPVAVDEPTTVTLALPDSFKADKAYVKHTKDDGTVYTDYETTIEAGTPRILTFVSTHGFSTFEISGEEFAPDLSDDASITSVAVGEYPVTNVDDAYTVTVPAGTAVTELPLTIVAADGAKVTVDEVEYEDGMTVDLTNPVTIVVTAEDGTTEATYTLTAVEDKPATKPSDKFTDIPKDDWSTEFIKDIIDAGIMNGTNSEGTLFSPTREITRKEFVVLVARADVMTKDSSITSASAADAVVANAYSGTPKYNDTKGLDKLYLAAIEYCDKKNIVNGVGENNFAPEGKVTREMAAKIVSEWAGVADTTLTSNTNAIKDWNSIGTWAQYYVNSAYKAGFMNGSGDGSFTPKRNLTRAETAKIVMLAYNEVSKS